MLESCGLNGQFIAGSLFRALTHPAIDAARNKVFPTDPPIRDVFAHDIVTPYMDEHGQSSFYDSEQSFSWYLSSFQNGQDGNKKFKRVKCILDSQEHCVIHRSGASEVMRARI